MFAACAKNTAVIHAGLVNRSLGKKKSFSDIVAFVP